MPKQFQHSNLSRSSLIPFLTLIVLFFSSCIKENQPPVATFTIDPATGNTETIFIFNASATTDPDNSTDDLVIMWDWEGDGFFDTPYAVKKTADHIYPDPGDYQVTLVARDIRGLTDTTRIALTIVSANLPPEQPSAPNPADGAKDLGVNTSISWDCVDPDGDMILYQVYYGTDNPPPVYLNNYTFNTFKPDRLAYGTTYYWKIKARDAKGHTVEGPVWSFSTIDIEFAEFTDERDGQTYQIVQIGDQWWMAQNLNYDAGDGSYCYEDNPARCEMYGRLYNWETAMKACPKGWHLPAKEEFNIMIDHLGGSEIAGGKLKDYESGWWREPNTGANNLSGFTALPAGRRYPEGIYTGLALYAQFYSATEFNDRDAYNLTLGYDYEGSFIYNYRKSYAISVRCIKD
ncbi:MAG: hypothetical protein J7L89_07040 [Bacteroidales bacterium]|nr:hypothetical protein [Bacteroidales bacterium]